MNVRIASATTMRSGVITSRRVTRRSVAQQLVHRDQVAHQALDVGHHPLVGEREIEERAGERPRRAQQRALAPEHAIQPPACRVGEREQPQRLAGRRAVDDDRVPVAGLGVGLELQEREQLVARPAAPSAPRRRSARRRDRRAPRPATPARPTSCARARPAPAPAGPTRRLRHRSARRPPAPAATRPASGRDRWTAPASAHRPPRSVAPWPPRPTSCRRRPCPCTG